jgi:hypothetical protein
LDPLVEILEPSRRVDIEAVLGERYSLTEQLTDGDYLYRRTQGGV